MALIDQVLIFVIVFILKRGKLASLVAQMVKASTYNEGGPGLIPGWGRSLEKEMATHSSTLAWKTQWMEKPGRLQPMELQRVGHD